ncbi:MAG: hypothetical protein K9L31_03305 [Candidatus Pacebacteria bacterium]|nr:hypothetical protein [Candidatus Paceibacterota bacterium]
MMPEISREGYEKLIVSIADETGDPVEDVRGEVEAVAKIDGWRIIEPDTDSFVANLKKSM